jgi:hypothetical protein
MKDTDSFYVRICGCGVIHLCFGATTINLTEQAVIAVTETLKNVSLELISKMQIKSDQSNPSNFPDTGNIIQGNFQNLLT